MRSIDADALLEDIGEEPPNWIDDAYCLGQIDQYRYDVACIKASPTLEDENRRVSLWVKMTGMMPPELTGYHCCNNCDWHEHYHNKETLYPFCPNCGAKMLNGIPSKRWAVLD